MGSWGSAEQLDVMMDVHCKGVAFVGSNNIPGYMCKHRGQGPSVHLENHLRLP